MPNCFLVFNARLKPTSEQFDPVEYFTWPVRDEKTFWYRWHVPRFLCHTGQFEVSPVGYSFSFTASLDSVPPTNISRGNRASYGRTHCYEIPSWIALRRTKWKSNLRAVCEWYSSTNMKLFGRKDSRSNTRRDYAQPIHIGPITWIENIS